nr:hypothetical protein [Tanacetum cinerariifolium]
MSSFYESPQCRIYLCQICESNSHYGYECSQRVPLVYEPEPCYIQNFSDNNSSHDLPSLHPLIDHHCCYECGNSLNDFFCYQCTCTFCGNGAHVGYNCPAQVSSVQTLPSFPQQYPCCEDFGVTHETYQCQPKNRDFYNEQDSCFDSNSFGFDQSQPQQYTVNHPIFNAHNDYLDSQIQLNSTLAKITKQMTSITSDSLDDNIISRLPLFFAITPDEPVLSTEEPDNSLSMGDEHLDTILATESDEVIKSSVENLISILSESEGIPDHRCDVPSHDNSPTLDVSKDQFEDFFESKEEFSSTDDDSFSFYKIDYVEASPPDSELVSSEVLEIVIPEVGGIEESNDNSIPFYDPIISRTPPNLTPSGESDFFLVVDAFLAVEDEPTSSQFPKSYFDLEGDMLLLEAFLNDDHSFDFKTNDDQSCSDEDVLEKIILKPLFEEEIIPMKIDQHPDNAESDLMESLRTHDSSLLISSKIDSLLDEFDGELTLLKSISPRIDETDCDFEEDICLIEKLLYDNSSPRPLDDFVSTNSDAKIKSFSPSPILVKDGDSLVEEIDLFYNPDYPMPPDIEDKDYDSERDILIRKDLPRNNTLSFAEKESFHFDIHSFSRPPAKPPDGDTGILNIKMMGDIYYQKVFMHKLMITLDPHQEKSPDLLSHRGLKAFSPLAKCPMMIHGQNNPILDVLLFYFYPP